MKHPNKEAQIQRMLKIANITPNLKEEKIGMGTLIDFKRGTDGVAYGIIKENHHYYLKKSNKKGNPLVEDFAYIGGLENITKSRYGKISEAQKQRNMILNTINEALGTPGGVISEGVVGEDAEEEIAKAEDAMGDLEVAVEKEKAEPEIPVDVPVDGGEMPVDVPVDGGEEMPVDVPVDGGEEMPVDVPVDGGGLPGEEMPGEEMPPEGLPGEELPGEELPGEEMPGEEGAGELGNNEELDEIDSLIGKTGEKVMNVEMTPEQTQDFVSNFLGYFKDKLAEIEVGERKKLANKQIIKVEAEEGDAEADLETAPEMDAVEEPELDMAEQQCQECGFAKFAESKGYGPDSIMECGSDERASLVSSYAMENEQLSEEDLESMSIISDSAMMESLKEDFGQTALAENMQPFVEQMNEVEDTSKKSKVDGMFWWMIEPQKEKDATLKTLTEQEIADFEAMDDEALAGLDEATLEELNFRGLKNVGKYMGGKAKSAVQGAGDAVRGAAQGVGQAVKGAATAVGDAVTGKIDQATAKLDQLGNEISQEYQKGVKTTVEAKLNKAAQKFGEMVVKLDQASQKAGDGPLNKQQFLMTLQGILKGGAVAETENGMDPAAIEVQPPVAMNEDEDEDKPEMEPNIDTEVDAIVGDEPIEEPVVDEPIEEPVEEPEIEMTPGFEVMGGGMPKPDGAGTTSMDVEVDGENKTVNIQMNEALAVMNEMLGEISTGLARKVEKKPIEKKSTPVNENEDKLRKYIRARLEEKTGKRKTVLNENEKSDKVKDLDKMIDSQFKLFESVLKEKGLKK